MEDPIAGGGWVRAWTVAVAAGLLACGGEGGDGSGGDRAGGPAPRDTVPAVQITDSAGVEIRTSPAARVADREWRVDPSPVARFDGREGGLEPFHFIASMAFDGDGAILVGEMALRRLRRYTLEGGFDRTLGRAGEGPGEFGALNHIEVRGDSIVVYDSRLNRLSVFASDGSFGRSFRLASRRGIGRFHGMFPDGRILGLVSVPGGDRGWGLWDDEGEWLRSMDRLPPLPPLRLSRPDAPDREPFRPFRASRFGAVAGGRIVWIDGGGYRFEIRDLRGRVVAVERLDLPARPLDAARREAWRTRTLQGRDPVPRALARAVEEAVFPETLPSLGNGRPLTGPTAVLDDEQGRIWVAEYPADAPQRWFVFAAGGGLAGHLTLPPSFELEAVRGDLLLGVHRDELEVQTAVVLRFDEG